MATIGTFKKSGAEFLGQIVTLNVQTKNVRITPEANRNSENAPSHRIFVGRAECRATPRQLAAENALGTEFALLRPSSGDAASVRGSEKRDRMRSESSAVCSRMSGTATISQKAA